MIFQNITKKRTKESMKLFFQWKLEIGLNKQKKIVSLTKLNWRHFSTGCNRERCFAEESWRKYDWGSSKRRKYDWGSSKRRKGGEEDLRDWQRGLMESGGGGRDVSGIFPWNKSIFSGYNPVAWTTGFLEESFPAKSLRIIGGI